MWVGRRNNVPCVRFANQVVIKILRKYIDMTCPFFTPAKLLKIAISVAGAAMLSLPRRPAGAPGASLSLPFHVIAADAVDADAALTLAKKNDCTKCHAIDKIKKGPAYKKVAEKYKGKADAEDHVTKSITTGPKVKLADGTEESHKVIDSKDPKAIKNLVDWILSQ